MKDYNLNEKQGIIRRYKSKGIDLDFNKMFNTYSSLEWYGFYREKRINCLPHKIDNQINWITIIRYVITNLLNKTTRDEIKIINTSILHKYGIYYGKKEFLPNELYNLLNLVFPEYNFMPWEMGMTQPNFFKNKDNIIKAIDWLLENNNLQLEDLTKLNISTDEFFAKNGLSCLIMTYFKGSQELILWYAKQKDININIHNFKTKTNGYWQDKNNADYQMKNYIKYLFDNNFISNIKIDLPPYLTCNYLVNNGYSMLPSCIKKYKYYSNMYQWINFLYPEFNLTEYNFKVFITCDGIYKCDSYEEKIIYDFIYKNYNLDIIKFKNNRYQKEFYNYKCKENYFPDFIVEKINDIKLDKKLIIEYYGMLSNKTINSRYLSYKEKTIRKNEFYKNNPDIYFIDLYTDDLKNNFFGLKQKFEFFFMSNFNITLPLKEVN